MSICSVSSSTKNNYVILSHRGKIKYSFMKSTKPYLYTVLPIICLPSSESFGISFFRGHNLELPGANIELHNNNNIVLILLFYTSGKRKIKKKKKQRRKVRVKSIMYAAQNLCCIVVILQLAHHSPFLQNLQVVWLCF